MTDDWLSIEGFGPWSIKLRELVDEAKAVMLTDDRANSSVVADRLADFLLYCNEDKLTTIANKTLNALASSAVSHSLDQLHAASLELDALAGELNAVSEESERTADWISLRTPVEIVSKLDETVTSVQALYDATKDYSNADEVKTKINALVQALDGLRDAVGQA